MKPNKYGKWYDQELSRGAGQATLSKRNEIDDKQSFERLSFERWLQYVRSPETTEEQRFDAVVGVISPLLEFLAGGMSVDQTACRVWALLYAVRPDLTDYEDYISATKRLGVELGFLSNAVLRLKELIPGFHFVKPRGAASYTAPRFSGGARSRKVEASTRGRRMERLRKEGAKLQDPAVHEASRELLECSINAVQQLELRID